MFDEIKNYISNFYSENEYPALNYQIGKFEAEKPLKNYKILDATPLFRNTLVKYLPLLASGADFTAAFGGNIPYDEKIVTLLQKWGVKTVLNGTSGSYDMVLDCGGANKNCFSRYGFVELTGSGAHVYRESKFPVFLADDSKIKLIETALGTGDGFLRSMQQLGFNDFSGKKVVIFGMGKVGFGVALYCKAAGAEVFAIDDFCRVKPNSAWHCISRFESEKLAKILQSADFIVSATGVKGALSHSCNYPEILKSSIVLVNIGLENEFGEQVPPERVVNHNNPVNFILEEPTHLKFIDPTMALSNHGALVLKEAKLPPGLNQPHAELSDFYLEIVRRNGVINSELLKLNIMR